MPNYGYNSSLKGHTAVRDVAELAYFDDKIQWVLLPQISFLQDFLDF